MSVRRDATARSVSIRTAAGRDREARVRAGPGRGRAPPLAQSPAAGEPVKITRLARGIPTGSVLEFANREMLADALIGRQEF